MNKTLDLARSFEQILIPSKNNLVRDSCTPDSDLPISTIERVLYSPVSILAY